MITDRDIRALMSIVHYGVLKTSQVQRLSFPDDDGRITRARLNKHEKDGIVWKSKAGVVGPSAGAPSSVWSPNRTTLEVLAEITGDESYLDLWVHTPNTHQLDHYTEISEFHIQLDIAIPLQDRAKLGKFYNEFDAVSNEKEPEKRYRLYTLIRQSPKLVCAPDAAFLLTMGDYSRVCYLEIDRASNSMERIAASKSPAYANLGELYKRHFPEAAGFSVFHVSPTMARARLLAKTMLTKDGAHLWRFTGWDQISPETLLTEPIWLPIVKNAGKCEIGEPSAILRNPVRKDCATAGVEEETTCAT
jgi:hypothetical protein